MNPFIQKSTYQNISQAYGGQSTSFKLRGTLVAKDGQQIKLDVGNRKILDIQLRKELSAKVGDTVILDKKEILSSQLAESVAAALTPEEENKYTTLLKMMQLSPREDFLQALQTLDSHGVALSKENLMSFISAKSQLGKLAEGLDYDTAVQLMERDVDVEGAPLEEVAQAAEEIKQEEKGFSLSKLLKQFRGLSTEEAEAMAQKIFGNRMGKDITDVIKALYKAGAEVTRKSINQVNEIFTKLNQVKEMAGEELVEALKGNGEATLDSLHRMKNAIRSGSLAVDEKVGRAVARAYEGFTSRTPALTERELSALEEDIREQLKQEGLEPTAERVQLAKEMIKAGLAVTKEHFDQLETLRSQIQQLAAGLDQEKVAQLLAKGIHVDKTQLHALLEAMNQLNTDVRLSGLDLQEQELKQLLVKLVQTGELQDKELMLLLQRKESFRLADLNRVVPTLENTPQEPLYTQTVKLSELLNQTKALTYDTLAFQIQQQQPITLESLSQSFVRATAPEAISLPASIPWQEIGLNPDQTAHLQMVQAIHQQGLPVSRTYVQRLMQIQSGLQFVRNQFTTGILEKGLEQGLQFETMEIERLAAQVGRYQQSRLEGMLARLPQLQQESGSLLAVMMKNNVSPSMKTLQRLSDFFHNEQQFGKGLQELTDVLEREQGFESELTGLKKAVASVTQGLKDQQVDLEKFQDLLKEHLGKALEKLQQGSPSQKEAGAKLVQQLLETTQTVNQLNHRDFVLQLPVLLQDQVKNLQIYVRNEKSGSRKIDPGQMSVLLNLDTNQLGNVTVYVQVVKKQVMLKIGVEKTAYKQAIDGNSTQLKQLLKDVGYEVKELSYQTDEEMSMLDWVETTGPEQTGRKHYIDITI